MYSEQTLTYLAADLTPLLPLTLSRLYQLPGQVKAASAERTRSVPLVLGHRIPDRCNESDETWGYLWAESKTSSRAAAIPRLSLQSYNTAGGRAGLGCATTAVSSRPPTDRSINCEAKLQRLPGSH